MIPAAPTISVIMPVYNAEATLDMAIGALVGDQFADTPPGSWEIVAVDDGSADRSLEILHRWEQRYPDTIHVITGPNRGVSHARNTALDAARGQWIAFIDADDYMLPRSLPALLRIATDTNAGVVRFGYRQVPVGTRCCALNTDIHASDTCSGLEFLDSTRGMIDSRSLWNACFGLFNRKTIHDIRFPENLIIGEDCIFTWQVMLSNPRVTMVDQDLYIYIQYPHSAMNSTDPTHLRRMMDGRRRFCSALLDLRDANASLIGPRAVEGLEIAARNAHNEALINAILLGDSFGSIRRAMQYVRHRGITVKPGKPRFYDRSAHYSTAVKLRRWLAAYPLPILIAGTGILHNDKHK